MTETSKSPYMSCPAACRMNKMSCLKSSGFSSGENKSSPNSRVRGQIATVDYTMQNLTSRPDMQQPQLTVSSRNFFRSVCELGGSRPLLVQLQMSRRSCCPRIHPRELFSSLHELWRQSFGWGRPMYPQRNEYGSARLVVSPDHVRRAFSPRISSHVIELRR